MSQRSVDPSVVAADLNLNRENGLQAPRYLGVTLHHLSSFLCIHCLSPLPTQLHLFTCHTTEMEADRFPPPRLPPSSSTLLSSSILPFCIPTISISILMPETSHFPLCSRLLLRRKSHRWAHGQGRVLLRPRILLQRRKVRCKL